MGAYKWYEKLLRRDQIDQAQNERGQKAWQDAKDKSPELVAAIKRTGIDPSQAFRAELPENEQIREQTRFNEQCLLIDNFPLFSKTGAEVSAQEGLTYKNFVMLEGDPAVVSHSIVAKYGINKLLNMTPAQSAMLYPFVRIYKVIYGDEKDKDGKDIEIPFKSFIEPSTVENLVSNRNFRGDDVGLKELSYEIVAKRESETGQATFKLKFFFGSLSSLFTESKEGVGFMDLIVPNLKRDTTNRDEFYKGRSRIKLVLGWGVPSDPTNELFDAEFKKALQASKSVFLLNLHDHDISFNEDGSAELSLEYIGSLEAILIGRLTDVFLPTKFSEQATSLRKKLEETETKKAEIDAKKPPVKPGLMDLVSGARTPEGKDELLIEQHPGDFENDKNFILKKKVLELEAQDKQAKYSRMITHIHQSSKLHYVDVDESHISNMYAETLAKGRKKTNLKPRRIERRPEKRGFLATAKTTGAIDKVLKTGWTFDPKNGIRSGRFGPMSQERREKFFKDDFEPNVATTKVKDGKRRIYFFYFGDLMDIALQALYNDSSSEVKNVKTLLGPIAYVDKSSNDDFSIKYINLADIPISLNLFSMWFMNKVVMPQKEKYPLKAFIQDAIGSLVVEAMNNENCIWTSSKVVMQSRVNINMYTILKKNPFPENGTRTTVDKIRNFAGDLLLDKNKSSDFVHLLYIFVSNYYEFKGKGNQKEDASKGIYHFTIGESAGLVKKMKFSKTDVPRYRSILATSASADSDKVLAPKYDLHLSLLGNNLFFQGMKVFVDTTRFGGGIGATKLGDPLKTTTLAYKMGLGGYYDIIKIDHVFSNAEWTVDMVCKWVSPIKDKPKRGVVGTPKFDETNEPKTSDKPK